MELKLETLEDRLSLSQYGADPFGYTFGASPYGGYTGTFPSYDSGYTYRIGEVNAYTGASNYSYYNGNGTWTGYSFQTPTSYNYYSTPSWYQDMSNAGYSRIGVTNPYTGYSSTNYYDNSGTYSGYSWFDNSYSSPSYYDTSSSYDTGYSGYDTSSYYSYDNSYSNDSAYLTFDENASYY
jgi:hypothetical protein